MKRSRFEYSLPKNFIANAPANPRDHSRLLVLDRVTASIQHKHFYDLSDIVSSTDVLVMNNTKVFPARVFGKRTTGGAVEVLFLKELENNIWEILGKNLPKIGEQIIFSNFYAKVIKKGLHTAKIRVFTGGKRLLDLLILEGKTPIPPYITAKLPEKSLRAKYQTVYAGVVGSVAAPTAGLHFTRKLLAKLKQKGVMMQYVTLHVGPGTFSPIKETDITKHKMHSEYYSVSKETVRALNNAKKHSKRIVAVGTTTARVLETISKNKKLSGNTDIFIYPEYKFNFVDALITNFHLPHSTLLALVSAFVSKPNTNEDFTDFKSSLIGKAYQEAIRKEYRFYSFGDAMLIA
ncbi:tRNA preQ1(34) S-adenosylmethionine ribosyltransferase-isomerase QueA [Candidatus Woesebacteria bacterium RIFCSPHIGHO2_01_FULL_44_21]|uniref:S-adenosylmethionine:tRNA ribosyltransferase-isomerase n=1 Tax=Candidatus Woesebacteria bacterium RIFCSPHIGHO2_01_FULL_44_21 TaxID=1802503 RepID=A0A1F7YWH0_9BACT|nr:MAG: tRNA preQ1(34) S-adenosylmethionine ribosyltransferase-isomerase QueA [Candidatus Woesebacteria bacterium RIFCSPHIGHO2_01_FULL_44_21]OGM68946.1 MAG: tRNA preQ1(34) S-adenosylmethionine ribosyltransferase-isomerase QueA [Candidatus Woesebacteria bacterium RIFCSPLOWO2_01_FULL_44_24b]